MNEDRYRPRASVGSSIRNDRLRGTSSELSVGPSLRIPTGGELRLSWSRPLSDRDRGPEGWTLGFQQPLLRGFGIDVETAPTRIARINERRNILSLHDTVVRTVTAVIREYRALIRARSAVQISREALARAVQQLETNRALISAGRMAVNEIIATEGEVANRRLALADAENAVVAANAALVSTLDIDTKTRIEAVEDLPAVAEQNPDVESNIATALANRRDYRRALMDREIAKINMRVAKDARRWDLTLQGTVSGSRGGEPGRTLGISLAIPFGDRTPKLRAMQARSTLRSTEIAIVELDQSIRIAVGQATLESTGRVPQSGAHAQIPRTRPAKRQHRAAKARKRAHVDQPAQPHRRRSGQGANRRAGLRHRLSQCDHGTGPSDGHDGQDMEYQHRCSRHRTHRHSKPGSTKCRPRHAQATTPGSRHSQRAGRTKKHGRRTEACKNDTSADAVDSGLREGQGPSTMSVRSVLPRIHASSMRGSVSWFNAPSRGAFKGIRRGMSRLSMA